MGNDELYKDLIKEKKIPQEKQKSFINQQLLNTIQSSPYFSKSKPEVNLDFIERITQIYNIGELREELKKMELWLISNPGREKSNYRKFITNWMSNKYRKIYIDK